MQAVSTASDTLFATPQFRTSLEADPGRGEAHACRARYAEMKTARRDREAEWRRWLRIVRGDHWGVGANPQLLSGGGWRARLVVNMTLALKRQKVGILLESRPRITLEPRSAHQMGLMAEYNGVLDHLREFNKDLKFLQKFCDDMTTYGSAIGKCYWDETVIHADGTRGEVIWKVLALENFFSSPDAEDIEDMTDCMELHRVTHGWLHDAFGKAVADRCAPDAGTESELARQRRIGFRTGAAYLQSAVQNGDQNLFDRTGTSPSTLWDYAQGGPGARYTVYEWWRKDSSVGTREVVVTEASPTGPVAVTKTETYQKYPYWRLTMVCGEETLYDGPAPYRLLPYFKADDIPVTHRFWGQGAPETCEPQQNELNKRRSQMVDHARLMGNAIWICDRDAGVKKEHLNNMPGAVIFKLAGKEIRRETAPPMPAFALQMVELPIREMREIYGVPVNAGQAPRGARSGAAVEAAAAVTTTIIRLTGQNLEQALADRTRIALSLVQQFYNVSRVIRCTGHQGMTWFTPFTGDRLRGDMDVAVEVSATENRQAQEQKLINLFQLQAIPRWYLLRKLGIEDWALLSAQMDQALFQQPQGWPGWPGVPFGGASSDGSGYSMGIRRSPQPMQPSPPAGQQGGNVKPSGVAPQAGTVK